MQCLLRNVTIHHAADAVGKNVCLTQMPVSRREILKNGCTGSCHNRQEIDYQFVYKVEAEQVPQKFNTRAIGNLGKIDAGITGTLLVANQIQHRMSGTESEGTPLQPVWKSLRRGLHPLHELSIRFREEAVEGHSCHYPHFCHIRLPLPVTAKEKA